MIRIRALTNSLAAGALALSFLIPIAAGAQQGNNKDFQVWLEGVRKLKPGCMLTIQRASR